MILVLPWHDLQRGLSDLIPITRDKTAGALIFSLFYGVNCNPFVISSAQTKGARLIDLATGGRLRRTLITVRNDRTPEGELRYGRVSRTSRDAG